MSARAFLSIPVQGTRLSTAVYDVIVDGAQEAGLSVVNVEVNDPPSTAQLADVSPQVVHTHNLALLEAAQLVIAEVSRPSLGVGYELAIAQARGLPILALCDAALLPELSLMIRGLAYERFELISYAQLDDVAGLIGAFVRKNDQQRILRPAGGEAAAMDKHFDELAVIYDDSTEWRQNQEMLDWLSSRLARRRLCLDVGTGTGLVGARIRLDGTEVVGLDRSEAMLRRAGGRLNWVVQGDCSSLPFRASAFDGAALRSVLHYVDDFRCLREIHRVLRDNGIFVCAQATGSTIESAAWWGNLKQWTQPLRQRFYTASILEQRLVSAGFQLLEIATIRMSRRETWQSVLRHCAATQCDRVRALVYAAPHKVRDDAELRVDDDGISFQQHWTLLAAKPDPNA